MSKQTKQVEPMGNVSQIWQEICDIIGDGNPIKAGRIEKLIVSEVKDFADAVLMEGLVDETDFEYFLKEYFEEVYKYTKNEETK